MSASNNSIVGLLSGNAGEAENSVTTDAFALNIAVGLVVFGCELSAFFVLKSAAIGRRIYQPKSYLVQERLRVEAIPADPIRWLRRIFSIKDDELKAKCGLDGYFFLRFLRAMIVIFLPVMVLLIIVLLPINYHGGKDDHTFLVAGKNVTYDVTGLNRLAWQNVAPTETDRYWAHLVCAVVAISWALYRIFREKAHYIAVRQQYLVLPENRLKASARTILITNIPKEFRSGEALKALYDIFVDNDDRSKLFTWVNRDYKPLRSLVSRRRKLCAALEKEELRILRSANKNQRAQQLNSHSEQDVTSTTLEEVNEAGLDIKHAYGLIAEAFEADCKDSDSPWGPELQQLKTTQVTTVEEESGHWKPVSLLARLWTRGTKRGVPKTAWLRSEIARLTVEIDALLPKLDDEKQFPLQNSAFVQFDRQMAAHMACSLVSHHIYGRMSPRFLDVAPHEILWPNMGVTSLGRFIRTCIAVVLFVGMLIFWGIPTTFLGILSQLETLRATTSWLHWLRAWPSWLISFIAGPLSTVLLALLVQLVVPALCRKLAVLIGAPTRSRREVITQQFYFAFLLVELVLVTSISSGLVATVPVIIKNPASIASLLATDLPKAANYFFNYLIIQAFGFSGSVLFQYLRILYITLIWPCFTQTPRQEAWLQTTIPHQMWGNVYPLFTNFAAIGLIYSVTSPLILVFSSATFLLFYVAYRHNYYYVQRNKVDTHGMLFKNALSQLFAGIYILEITLVGLFFLVRDEKDHVACKAQAIIMIVVLIFTAAFQFVSEQFLSPLNEFLPVTLDDDAVEKEKQWLQSQDAVGRISEENKIEATDAKGTVRSSSDEEEPRSPQSDHQAPISKDDARMATRQKGATSTAAKARLQLSRLKYEASARLAVNQALTTRITSKSSLREAEDKLGAAIAGYPDELKDLSPQDRDAQLKAAYQDPVTREPTPIIWIPHDAKGGSVEAMRRAKKYGKFIQYSDAGATLAANNKCIITEPAPDVRGDWLLDWVL